MPPPQLSIPMPLPSAAWAVLLYAAAIVVMIAADRVVTTPHAARSWRRTRRVAVDDAYTAWLDAHSRCGQALRAWNAARPAARGAAYRTYLAELEREEEAARRLERLQPTAGAV